MKVLVAPLDWGLGHATRCIPLIKGLLDAGAEVELATCGSMVPLYKEVFPELRQRRAPSYKIVYPKLGFSMPFWLMKNMAHFSKMFKLEHRWVESLVSRHHYDIIISDNRFGCYSKKIKSIYLTHQLRIGFPTGFQSLEAIGIHWHLAQMKHFSEVWIPDFEEFPGLAGKLSHVKRMPPHFRYIGLLSRFNKPAEKLPKEINVLGIVSGVEPMRSQFERKLRLALQKIPGEHVMLLGNPSASIKKEKKGNITSYNHLDTDSFTETVLKSKYVVARSGYSTIMDMAVLGSNCVFVPTPGQTEQLYLADSLEEAANAMVLSDLLLTATNLKTILSRAHRIPAPELKEESLLTKAINAVLKSESL